MSDKQQLLTQAQETFCWREISSLKFVIQFFFSVTIMIFCMFQLVRTDVENKNVALYWSCISGILALWMPSPTSTKGSTSTNQIDVGSVSVPNANLNLNKPLQKELNGTDVNDSKALKS